jgi:hypothetical protein
LRHFRLHHWASLLICSERHFIKMLYQPSCGSGNRHATGVTRLPPELGPADATAAARQHWSETVDHRLNS